MAPSAGWYDNPEDPAQLRWWDGTQWTEHYNPKPPAEDLYAAKPRTATGSTPQAVGIAKLVRPRNIGIAAGAALVVFLAGGAFAAGNARDNLTQDVSAIAEAPTPTRAPTPDVPKETDSIVSETVAVPFARSTVDDPNLASGTSAVTQAGADGVQTKTYRVTLRDGVEVGRVLLTDEVTTPAVDEITTIGTYVAPPPPPAPVAQAPAAPAAGGGCDPNYAGQCVPVASDVDCGGGGGNGPEYVWGAVRIVGTDIYDLDRDGDGVACDS